VDSLRWANPRDFAASGSGWDNGGMNDPQQQPKSRRQRLQALLAIPDKERTEEQWDEINELEIGLASGNRTEGGEHGPQHGPQHGSQRGGNPGGGGGGGQPRPGGDGQGRKQQQFKRFNKRPPNRGAR
jgi:hypothetical protein